MIPQLSIFFSLEMSPCKVIACFKNWISEMAKLSRTLSFFAYSDTYFDHNSTGLNHKTSSGL